MKTKIPMRLVAYFLALIGLLIYSFALVDPNLTLINHPLWEQFRNTMVGFGYLNRYDSWPTYLGLIIVLFGFHISFIRKEPKISPLKLSFVIGGILLLAYPLLSHDFFNYIFDARIFTLYGENPYVSTPASFSGDEWLRFMQWTHRTYPYGPTFLPITIAISAISLSKLILNYVLFKGLFVAMYIGSVWLLQKMNKTWALFFATSPLIIMEGLVNAHNDLIAVFFGLLGVYILIQGTNKHKQILTRLSLLISGGIKYFTLPTILLQKPVKKGPQHPLTITAALGVVTLILYVSFTGALQPWYFLNLFVFLPYYFEHFKKFQILMFGLVISYYPIIRFGKWETTPGVNIKNIVVFVALGLNIAYLLVAKIQKRKR